MKLRIWLFACLPFLFAGCASLEPPEVRLVGLTPLESTLLEPRMRLEFRLLNPGQRVLRVKGLDVGLRINGVDFARGIDGHGFELPGMGETIAGVDVSVSLLRLIEILLGLPEAESFDYELSGHLDLAGFPRTLPISRAGSISRRQLQDLRGDLRGPGTLRLD